MIEAISNFDHHLLLWLNGHHNETMDGIMVFISGKFQWIPLYALLLYFIIKKYGKQTVWILLGAALTITLADQISVHFFKEVFQRYRPCHNLDFGYLVHTVNNKCGGKYGFVSSHAANSFAIATYVGFLLKRNSSKLPLVLLLLWAAVVSYSRIYLGVHYPGDVAVGGLLGILIGFFVYRILIFTLQKIQKE